MKKIAFALFFLLTIPCFPVSASESITVTNTGAPTASFYPSEFDQLVMDFTVARADGTADVLNALTLQNLGTARDYDFSKVVVWADAGPAGFQGMDIDQKLGEATRYETGGFWFLSGLTKLVPASGLRIFVSIETGSKGAITVDHTVQMEVSPLHDVGTAGQFDLGTDTGLFFAGATGVAEGIVNPFVQTIRISNYDTAAPKTVIISPANGATISTSIYKIMGSARDQGGSTPASVQIKISSASSAGSWADVTATGDNFSTWEYDWTSITDGTYTIKTQGADWLSNTGEGSPITVTVNQTAAAEVSAGLSTASVSPSALAADGVAEATVSVTVKNSAGNPLAGKTVTLSSSRSADTILAVKDVTGADGLATFSVSSTTVGSATLTAAVGTIVLDQKPTLTFTAVAAGHFSAGDLIKGAGTTVYYFDSTGERYLFPTLATYSSWYTGFSGVKTISDADLIAVPLGGNVTVRPGKLVQVVSMDTPWRVMDPKVYAVSRGGVLRWIKTAGAAVAIFGANWEKQIVAVPETLLTNYTFGTDISSAADYNLSAEQAGTIVEHPQVTQ